MELIAIVVLSLQFINFKGEVRGVMRKMEDGEMKRKEKRREKKRIWRFEETGKT
jgi:hypothetical protein